MPTMRRLTTALSIAALGLTASASAAQAAANLALSTASAPPGTPVKVSGTGYGAHEVVDVTLDAATDQTVVATGTGAFNANLPLPSNVKPGAHQVTAVGRTSGSGAGATLTITTPWAQEGFNGSRQNDNLYENQINQGNVDNLQIAWSADLPANDATAAVVSGGKVFVGSGTKLLAYKVGCGTTGASCTSPIWTADLGDVAKGSPAVLGNYVYVTTYNGKLEAFKTTCATGGAACTPVWTADASAVYGSPAVSSSPARIYVGSWATRTLSAYNPTCGAKTCAPAWKAALDSGPETSPSVVNGAVYIGTDNGEVEAFSDAACAKRSCAPVWTQTTGNGGLFDNMPVASGRIFAFGSTGTFGLSTTCASSPCAAQWSSSGSRVSNIGLTGGLATNGAYVFATDSNGVLRRIGQACASGGGSCSDTTIGSIGNGGNGTSAPTLADDVLYAVVGNGSLGAYAPGCTPDATRNCTALWQMTDPAGGTFDTTPVVSDGTLYASAAPQSSSGGARLYAYTLGGVAAGTTP